MTAEEVKEGGEEIEGDEIGMKRQKGERRIDSERGLGERRLNCKRERKRLQER